jgi:hypothetical protein
MFTVITALVVASGGSLRAQMYGGGMQRSGPSSQPMPRTQPPTQQTQKQPVATEQIGAADVSGGIKQYVDAASNKSSDKKFHLKHEGQDIALDSLKVHEDRMADLGGGKYVACTNMRGADGKSYDIDFFLTGKPGSVRITQASLHKIDGNALYSWKKQGGVWKMSR